MDTQFSLAQQSQVYGAFNTFLPRKATCNVIFFPHYERTMALFVCDLFKMLSIIFTFYITYRDLFLSKLLNMNSSKLILWANIF